MLEGNVTFSQGLSGLSLGFHGSQFGVPGLGISEELML